MHRKRDHGNLVFVDLRREKLHANMLHGRDGQRRPGPSPNRRRGALYVAIAEQGLSASGNLAELDIGGADGAITLHLSDDTSFTLGVDGATLNGGFSDSDHHVTDLTIAGTPLTEADFLQQLLTAATGHAGIAYYAVFNSTDLYIVEDSAGTPGPASTTIVEIIGTGAAPGIAFTGGHIIVS